MTETESGAAGTPPSELHRLGDCPADAVREALRDGPREAGEMASLLRAAGFGDAQIAKAKREAGAVSERGGDGIWRWRLDMADDLLLVADCTEQVEAMPLARKQRRRIERLLAKRRRLLRELEGTGPCDYQRDVAATLAGVEAELVALDVELVEEVER